MSKGRRNRAAKAGEASKSGAKSDQNVQNQSRNRGQNSRTPNLEVDQDVQNFLGGLRDMFNNMEHSTQVDLQLCKNQAEVDEIKKTSGPRVLELLRMERLIVDGTKITDETFSKYFDEVVKDRLDEKTSEISERLEDLGKMVEEKAFDHIHSSEVEEELKTHPKYLKWLELFENLTIEDKSESEQEPTDEDEDGDLPTRDPFTQNILKDPIRNSLCGHIYSLSVIMAFLNKKLEIRCPYEGCKNINTIDSTHLVHDPCVKEKIQKILAKAEKAGAGAGGQSKSLQNVRASSSASASTSSAASKQ